MALSAVEVLDAMDLSALVLHSSKREVAISRATDLLSEWVTSIPGLMVMTVGNQSILRRLCNV